MFHRHTECSRLVVILVDGGVAFGSGALFMLPDRLDMRDTTNASGSGAASAYAGSVEDALVDVEGLLAVQKTGLRFPERLENIFQAEISEARVRPFVRAASVGLFIYNSFLITDVILLSDIIAFVCIVQLGFITPVIAILILLIHKKIIRPEPAIAVALSIIVASILLFYSKSEADHSSFIIFTIPVCLAFGNVVLPLPFRLSAFFTALCILVSSAAFFTRSDWDPALGAFSGLINLNCGAYMLLATYRMEGAERRAYLFNLRETLRAEMLTEKNRLLRDLCETDALTGIANRRCFDANLEHLLETGTAATSLSLVLIDIDHFKSMNDSFGHQAGDRALQLIADCLRRHSFPDAIVARYGGEEFAVLLPGAGTLHARSCAEVLRSAVERLADTTAGDLLPRPVTISIGLATMLPDSGYAGVDLVKAADKALYRAKANGRNRVECASQGEAAGTPTSLRPAGIAV